MKPNLILLLAALTVASIVVTSMSTHQVYAPRTCGGCAEFKKLTHEFEQDVLDAAVVDPNIIPGLIDQYTSDVRAIDFSR